jgi:uncharacterized secreted protein with C-terminal beta-propeller domain
MSVAQAPSMPIRLPTRRPLLGLTALIALAACETSDRHADDPPTPTHVEPGDVAPGDNAEDFVSHVAGESNGGAAGGGAPGSSESADAGSATRDDSATGGDLAARAIAEADLIQREGDTLYALSAYAGLSIVDISNPKALVLKGNYRSNATPFEMYLREGVAYIMYNNYGRYSFDEAVNAWTYRSSSHITALDVSDPAAITPIGEHEVPGSISDSRLVGDVLYLVTYENGYCWDCKQNPNTRVASFDVKDPAHFDKIDELRFEETSRSYGQRSISVTTQRIYVGGPTWENRDSNIQVVDIADPAGDLQLGADIPLHGSVQSRWQMDEFQGVLRVISQPTAWRTNDPPHVQTFRVESSAKVTKLADLPVRLPRPENLQSVRFDGLRGYAITFQQTDPLFTFDLSDPAHPKQVGELEIPGFVYHMEPRGDRLYALGFDRGNKDGSLHASIFDVSKLEEPRMISRVNFGGDWGSFAEDQDRLHKAFNILPEEELIMVPFSGGSYDESRCHYSYNSGIQLIDLKDDTLTLRGVAPQVGSARRAFLHRSHLFGITDNALSVFDIADRDQPASVEELEVARNISQVHVMGDTLLRFGVDWWTSRSVLDFTTLDASSTAEPLGELDLASLVNGESKECQSSSNWEGQLYVHGDVAYAPRRGYRSWNDAGRYRQEQTLTLYIIDLRDRKSPKLAGTLVVEHENENQDGYLGGIVLTDHALLVGRTEGRYYASYDENGTFVPPTPKYSYDIYDLKDPLEPAFTKRFEVPSRIAGGGWGYGYGGCGIDMAWGFWRPGYGSTGALVSGDLVVSQHEEDVDDGSHRVRYYLDRLDVSDPSKPTLLPQINIPGQVVHFDGETQRLVTMEDLLHSEKPDQTWMSCYERGTRSYLSREPNSTRDVGVCRTYRRRANALVLEGNKARRISMVDLDSDERVSGTIAISDERLFYTSSKVRPHTYEGPPDAQLDAFAFSSMGQFVRLPPLVTDAEEWGSLSARGARAFQSTPGGLVVVDTRDTEHPSTKRHDLQGWGCASLEVQGDRAYCALGQHGVVALDL